MVKNVPLYTIRYGRRVYNSV